MKMLEELKKEAHNIKVLFVEDDSDFTKVMEDLLKKFFKNVVFAKDGEDGLKKYREGGPFEIVLSDITMPVMDGLEMSENIKKENPEQHIMIISAHSDANKLIKAIDIGVDSFILKPVDSFVLLERLLGICKAVNGLLREQREKELERLLFNQSRMAAMGEMISIISHQLKQPLYAMSMLTANMKSRFSEVCQKSDDDFNQSVEWMSNQIKFMSATIDTFANFLKPQKSASFFSVQKSVLDIVSILSAKLKSEGIDLVCDVDSSIQIYGFEKEFNQAILNIISNAIDAFKNSDRERKIVVEASADNGVFISIKDNAGGIGESVKNRIFDPYFTTKGDSGTGIGLYITKKIIEDNFSGKVTVENEDGGARFDIWFPAQ